MSTKETTSNPFELRLQMLQMAKDYLDRQYDMNYNFLLEQWHAAKDLAVKMQAELPKMPEPPKMYGAEEIGKMAQQFNEFVSGFVPKK